MKLSKEEFIFLKKGDKVIFTRIYDHYKNMLYSFLLSRLDHNEDIASDVLSETIFSALKSISRLNDRKKIQSWLFQIAQRRLMDFLRKKYRENKRKNLIEEKYLQDFICESDLSDEVIKNEKVIALHIALDNLDEEYAAILKKKYFEGLSYKEIADDLSKSTGAVESLLYRARKALKNELCRSSEIFEEELS